MANPKPEIKTPDEDLYVSPTANDSLAERYAKIKEEEKTLSTAERLKRLRDGAKLFEKMASDKGQAEDEA